MQTDLDEIDDPTSGDTTQLLYKQHIEDHSSTHIANSISCGSPDPVQDSYYKRKQAMPSSSSKSKKQQMQQNSHFNQNEHNNWSRKTNVIERDENHMMIFTGKIKNSNLSRQANKLEKVCRNTIGAATLQQPLMMIKKEMHLSSLVSKQSS